MDEAGHGTAIPPELRRIMCSEKNYRNYRDELQNGPALPFLFPTLRDLESVPQYSLEAAEYEACRERIICSLREVFAFMSYEPGVQGVGIMERIGGVLKACCCI